ncbi:hypothetical protein QJQ45_028386, partial [Haematococcus lacustris]
PSQGLNLAPPGRPPHHTTTTPLNPAHAGKAGKSGGGHGGTSSSSSRPPQGGPSTAPGEVVPLLPEGQGQGTRPGQAAAAQGEFRNRLRGGGGGDLPSAAGASRRELKRWEGEGEEVDEDERHPLHVGGLWGHLGTVRHALAGYLHRKLADPVTLLMASHKLLTITHFVTWWGGVGSGRVGLGGPLRMAGWGGPGPSSASVQQFDDIVVALMLLAGWTSLLFYARGVEAAGQLAVVLELCMWVLLKFCALYLVLHLGYAMAFYTLLNGTTAVLGTPGNQGVDVDAFPQPRPFANIGLGFMELLRFLYGEAEYATYSASPFQAKRAVASALFVLYLVTCLLLLTNLLTALVLHAVKERYAEASRIWRLRWASYVLKAEARMPRAWQRRYRLGEPSYDSALQQRVYNHVGTISAVFEVVADKAEDSTALEALEAVMERLKKPKKVAL